MITVYRLLKSRYESNPLSADGAKNYGGRWNSKRIPMVYASDSIALAALEKLVHLHRSDVLNAYSLCAISLPEKDVMSLDSKSLPSDWRDDPVPASTIAIGDEWVSSTESLGLWVPSTVIPEQNNMLLNPGHPNFEALIKKTKVSGFVFDTRLAD